MYKKDLKIDNDRFLERELLASTKLAKKLNIYQSW